MRNHDSREYRLGEAAMRVIAMIKNVFDKIFSRENLYRAMQNASRGRRLRPEIAAFNFEAWGNINELKRDIYAGEYRLEKYREFYVNEPKKRLIMSVPFRDRVVQWAIYRVINQNLINGYIKDSYGCIPGRGSLCAMRRLKGWMEKVSRKPDKWYYLKLDISKYYYRISHEILKALLAKKIKDKRLLELLGRIIDCDTCPFGLPDGADLENIPPEERLYDTGMPIGNLLSQMFANIYLDTLDQHCKRTLGIKYYIRYMDDIIILGNDKSGLAEIKGSISRFLQIRLRLKLNNKTCIRPIAQGVEFVGYRIWANRVNVRKSTTLHMKRGVRGIVRKFQAGIVSADKAGQVFSSILGMLAHTDSKEFKECLRNETTLSLGYISERDKEYMNYMAKGAVLCGY